MAKLWIMPCSKGIARETADKAVRRSASVSPASLPINAESETAYIAETTFAISEGYVNFHITLPIDSLAIKSVRAKSSAVDLLVVSTFVETSCTCTSFSLSSLVLSGDTSGFILVTN